MILDIELPSYDLIQNEKDKLGEILLKAQAIDKNLDILVDNPNNIEKICVDFDWELDEFYLLNYDGGWENHIEVVTDEITIKNDFELLMIDGRYTSEDLKTYEAGNVLSDYKKLGNSNYYYKEL